MKHMHALVFLLKKCISTEHIQRNVLSFSSSYVQRCIRYGSANDSPKILCSFHFVGVSVGTAAHHAFRSIEGRYPVGWFHRQIAPRSGMLNYQSCVRFYCCANGFITFLRIPMKEFESKKMRKCEPTVSIFESIYN